MILGKIEAGILIPIVVGFFTLISNEVNFIFVGLYGISFIAYFIVLMYCRKIEREQDMYKNVDNVVAKAIRAQILSKSSSSGYGYIDFGKADYYGEIFEGAATGYGVFLYKNHPDSCYMGEFLDNHFWGYGEFRNANKNLRILGRWKVSLPEKNHYVQTNFELPSGDLIMNKE